jgi:hypothetical protein
MVQKAVWKRSAWWMILTVSLVLAGCQRAPRQPPAGTPAAAGKTAPGAQAPAASPAHPGKGAPAATAAAPQAPAAQSPGRKAAQPVPGAITLSHDVGGQTAGAGAPATAAGLMSLDREKRMIPEDFKIGPLGEAYGGTADENGAIAAADAFLASVVAGKVDQKLLAPESEKTVADTVSFGLQQGYAPKSFRVGAPKVREDGEITATVRLFGQEGSSEGEIYLSRVGKSWLVSDLQLSLAEMAVKKEKPKEKFFPSTYRWLLED